MLPGFFLNRAFRWVALLGFWTKIYIYFFYFPILHLGELQTTCNCFIQNRPTLLYNVHKILVYSMYSTHIEKVHQRGPRLYTSACVACAQGCLPAQFLIGNLSYTPSSEPSRTVLLLNVMYTTDPHHWCNANLPFCATPF